MSKLIVNCPNCDAELLWGPDAQYRPFCSERCRLIDLGEWFTESRRIASEAGEESPAETDDELAG